MKRSLERILTTHTGSLPRPASLRTLMADQETDKTVDGQRLADEVRLAVADTVQKQCETGIDVVNDGEMSKFFYATYIKERLSGFKGASIARVIGDTQDFPEYTARINPESRSMRRTPACNGPIAYLGRDDLEADLANLAAATAGDGAEEVFLTAASPKAYPVVPGLAGIGLPVAA